MTSTTDPLHIVQLTVENVKRIRAVSITPQGDVVVLSGRNAQGKTSVLDAIWLALGGGTAKRDTKVSSPIREGQDEAMVDVDLGQLRVIRSWKRTEDGEATTKLSVVNSEGLPLGSPQSVLDALVKHVGFDPLAFTRLPDKEQVAALAQVVDLPFDPDGFDQVTKGLFDQRTVEERERKRLEAVVAGTPRFPNAPAEPVIVADVVQELDDAREFFADGASMERALVDADRARDDALALVDRLQEELNEARRTAKAKAARRLQIAEELEKWRSTASPPDVEEIKARLAGVTEINEKVAANARYAFIRDQLTAQTGKTDGLTAQIEHRREEKRRALAAAKFPVEGLSFEDGKVMYQGQPFRQASGAEQVQVSTAIAMAGEPRLRVITIRDASLLDAEHLDIVERMAAESGFQIWLEKVDDTGQVGVVIEDGSVRG